MSALTKILIVLLTLSSIFLCGIVVTYVANAEDYKQQNETLRTRLQAAKESERNANDQLGESEAKSERLETTLSGEIASLKTEIRRLNNAVRDAERERAKLLQEVTSMASVVETANQTAEQQTQLFKKAQEELIKTKAEQEKERKELSDITAALNEKMAVIAMLDADKRRLQEEKAELQEKLDRFLREFGREAIAPVPVTPTPAKVQPVLPTAPKVGPVAPVVRKIGLKGLVMAVDLKNSVAEISIGTAQGVRENMKFYVTRGDDFICELWIHYVDSERAIGELKLVQKQPKVGDVVATNL